MPGTRFMNPNDSLAPRSPTTNEQANGNIINPPRYAQLGGLSSGGARGIMQNSFKIEPPGQTIASVPVRSTR